MTKSEARVRGAVYLLHGRGIFPSPTAVAELLGFRRYGMTPSEWKASGRRPHMYGWQYGRSALYRRRALAELGYQVNLRSGRFVTPEFAAANPVLCEPIGFWDSLAATPDRPFCPPTYRPDGHTFWASDQGWRTVDLYGVGNSVLEEHDGIDSAVAHRDLAEEMGLRAAIHPHPSRRGWHVRIMRLPHPIPGSMGEAWQERTLGRRR